MDKIFEHNPVLGVLAVFQSAKESSSHERLMKNLFNIFSNSSQSTFILEFLQCISIAMKFNEKHPQVENSLDFAAKYCIYHGSLVGEEDNVLLLAVFEFIFDNHNRKLQAIRYRTCEFVNRLLNKMGPQASLDNDIFDKMASTMLERLQDKIPSIRAQAVMALQRLQDPPNKNCRIMKAFSYHMESDPSCDVRARVVQNIAVTPKTLPLILGRLQDLKETVRKEAYKALSRLKPQKFTIRQRQTILTSGFADRSDIVKSYVKDTVVPSWFNACNSNLLDFLSILDVVTLKPEALKNVLTHLYGLKEIPRAELIAVVEKLEAESSGRKVIPYKELTPETATVWASTIQHLGFDACDTVLLPELTHFAKYVSLYCNEANLKLPDDQYILKQLMEIAKCYSFMDEMGRKQLIQTCTDILKNDNIGIEIIPSITTLLELLVTNVKERMLLMAELISDIREPLECNDVEIGNDVDWEAKTTTPENENIADDSVEKISEGLSQLNCESQSLEDCGRAERTDSETLIKCLTIIKEMLKSPSINKVDTTLLSLKEHFIIKCFNSSDGRVLSLAIDALSLLCIWSLDIAKDFFLKFCIQISNDLVSLSALEAVFDILLVHGFEPFSYGCFLDTDSDSSSNELGEFLGEGTALDFTRDPTFTPTTRRIVPLLTSLLKSSVNEVKCKVSEGLSKLLLSFRIDSSIVLAHLIILWFSPATDKEPMIRQSLGLFFSVFSSRRVGAADIILQAFSPTLRGTEELHDELMDQGKISNLFVTLLRSDISSKIGKPQREKGSYHGQLALIILEEIRHEVISLQILAKALSGIQLEESDGVIAEKLSSQAVRTYKWLSRRSGERRILNIIKKIKEEADRIQMKYEEKNENVEPKPEVINESLAGDISSVDGRLSTRDTSRRNRSLSISKQSNFSDKKKFKKSEGESSNTSQNVTTLSEVTFSSKAELEVIEESTTLEEESNEEHEYSPKRLSALETESVIAEESTRSSEDIIAPSPPKRRMLRSHKK